MAATQGQQVFRATSSRLSLNKMEVGVERPILMIMQGLPGSGKTKIAMQYVERGYQLVQKDCLRYAFDIDKNWNGWSEELERKVNEAAKLQLNGLMRLGLNIVVDETNTKMEKFDVYCALAYLFHYNVVVHRVDTPVSLCKERRLPNGFPDHVIDRINSNLDMFKRVIDPMIHDYEVGLRISSVTEEGVSDYV